MMRGVRRCLAVATLFLVAQVIGPDVAARGAGASSVPDLARDMVAAFRGGQASAVVAGALFWGLAAIFGRLNGVSEVVSGFAGGSRITAHYEIVSMGGTGHAESVKITYDPSQITFGRLLKIYFAVAHDPTQLNRQGPDEGTQY